MQIKTTVRCHLTPVRTAIIKKKTPIAPVGKDMEKREPLAVGMDVNWYSHYGKQNEISENKALFFL